MKTERTARTKQTKWGEHIRAVRNDLDDQRIVEEKEERVRRRLNIREVEGRNKVLSFLDNIVRRKISRPD